MQSAAAAVDTGSAASTSSQSTAGLTSSQGKENLIWHLCLCLGRLTQSKVVAEKGAMRDGRGDLFFKKKKGSKRKPIKVAPK